MRAGKSAPDALHGLLIADDACNVRQVAMVDTQGRVATFTGGKDIEPAGGIAGASTGILCPFVENHGLSIAILLQWIDLVVCMKSSAIVCSQKYLRCSRDISVKIVSFWH
jgi:hypothetical protein